MKPRKWERAVRSTVGLHSRSKVVAASVCDLADRRGRVWSPAYELAEMSGVSEKTAKRALDDLVNAGFLVRTGYGRPSNITDYQITIPESATAVTPEGPLVHVEFYGRQS